MKIPDANILLYAYVPSFKEHTDAKKWLETTLNEGEEVVGLSWQAITSFLRIGTNPRVFSVPFKSKKLSQNLRNFSDIRWFK